MLLYHRKVFSGNHLRCVLGLRISQRVALDAYPDGYSHQHAQWLKAGYMEGMLSDGRGLRKGGICHPSLRIYWTTRNPLAESLPRTSEGRQQICHKRSTLTLQPPHSIRYRIITRCDPRALGA